MQVDPAVIRVSGFCWIFLQRLICKIKNYFEKILPDITAHTYPDNSCMCFDGSLVKKMPSSISLKLIPLSVPSGSETCMGLVFRRLFIP